MNFNKNNRATIQATLTMSCQIFKLMLIILPLITKELPILPS